LITLCSRKSLNLGAVLPARLLVNKARIIDEIGAADAFGTLAIIKKNPIIHRNFIML
jgi:hypothetical protein